jgi:hypothetical protein
VKQLDSPRLSTVRAKMAELQVEKARLKADGAVIRSRIQNAPHPGNEHERRVKEILGETPVAVELSDADQLRSLQRKIETIDAALAVLDAEFQKELRIVNNDLVVSVRPEIKRLGSKFADAFRDLHAAHLEFDDYIDDLENVGASVGQFRIRPNGLSHPKDLSGSYAYGLKEFIDLGFFQKSNMPKVLR